jgi:acyl CoA:acetate/3-ketoacid CoA transferase alpha subunit/acyl CoA:acetate/3-ketoacid CoA transferase beta subunit
MTQTALGELAAAFDIPDSRKTPKVMPLSEAVHRFISPGMAIHCAYSNGRCHAAQIELVRQFSGTAPNFTLITPSMASTAVALVRAGLVTKLVTPFAGELYPSAAPNPLIQRAIDSGSIAIENWSLWTFVARLAAGALGVPFFPTRSLAGSGMANEHFGSAYAEVANPFESGGGIGVVLALRPDITFIQAVAADPDGNVIMAAPYGEGYWGALASRNGVIACVERIASADEIRANNSLVRIPGHVVRAVCAVPLGSHPFGLFNPGFPGVVGYAEDQEFIRTVARACQDDETFDSWMQEWIHGTASHADWIAKLGATRVNELTMKGQQNAWRLEMSPELSEVNDASWSTDSEKLVVLTARVIADRLRTGNFDTVLSGVGLANLASWLAVRTVNAEGRNVELMAEIGMYGYTPRPGDPYVFANRNIHTAKALVDVMAVLGTLVSGTGNRCLGVIGGNLVDPYGNVGTTYDQDGHFLVGSGGANDIASAASEVVLSIRQSSDKLLETMTYVTSPGTQVRTLVTQLGVFERSSANDRLKLTRFLMTPPEDSAESVGRIRAESGWGELPTGDQLVAEAQPKAAELQAIRLYDPHRILLGRRPIPSQVGKRQ